MKADSNHINKHISRGFNDELEAILTKVLHMGGLVEEQLESGLKAIDTKDAKLGEQVIIKDKTLNEIELEIDRDITQIFAIRQPAASDLRMLISISKTVSDLERIGDEAKRLGKMAVDLSRLTHKTQLRHNLVHLGSLVSKNLKNALDALARMDVKAALETSDGDEAIDVEYESIIRQLMTYMMEDPRNISAAMDVIWSARALERIGDHAKNICEYVSYYVLGKDIRHGGAEKLKASDLV